MIRRAALSVLLAALLAGCGAGLVQPAAHVLTGSIEFGFTMNGVPYQNETWATVPVGGPCSTERMMWSGRQIPMPGQDVLLTDQAGTILGKTELPMGVTTDTTCRMSFTIPDVPEATFFSLGIANEKPVIYSLADMKAHDWKVDLSLGCEAIC